MNLEQIDTSTTAGKAEVMRLAAEGRRVAYDGGTNFSWVACIDSPLWNWGSWSYAIIAEPILDRPARVGGRDFPAGALIQQVIGRAHAEYDRHHHRRDPRDVASDPEGILLVSADEPLMAAPKREPIGPEEVWVAVGPGPTLEGARWNPSDAQRLLPGVEGQVVKYIRADLAGEGEP